MKKFMFFRAEAYQSENYIHLNLALKRLKSFLQDSYPDLFYPEKCGKNLTIKIGPVSAPYVMINPEEGAPIYFQHLCDHVSHGGGWIVIQRRHEHGLNFDREWIDYKRGFGSFDGDFWLGNDKIYHLTRSEWYELRVELTLEDDAREIGQLYANYRRFKIYSESSGYLLFIKWYCGTTGDILNYHRYRKFTTYDRDNDRSYNENCATKLGGGWWFSKCTTLNLNGDWRIGSDVGNFRLGHLIYSEMKMRPIVYSNYRSHPWRC